jgi:hypothetical protein
MEPIAFINSQLRMRDSLIGAVADDPVVPEPKDHVTQRGVMARRIGVVLTRAFGNDEGPVHVQRDPTGARACATPPGASHRA